MTCKHEISSSADDHTHCWNTLLSVHWKLTLGQERLLSMALKELVRAGTIHAIWVTKCGSWLHRLHSHLILLWVDLALVL